MSPRPRAVEKAPATVAALDAEVAAVGERLDELRRERGQAMRLGRVFAKPEELKALSDRLEALRDVRSDVERAEQEEAEDGARNHRQGRRHALLVAFRDAEAQRIAAYRDAEKATVDLAAALKRILDAANQSREASAALSNERRPGDFAAPRAVTRPHVGMRLSERIAAILREAIGERRLGRLDLAGHPGDARGRGWGDAEMAEMVRAMSSTGLLGDLEDLPEPMPEVA